MFRSQQNLGSDGPACDTSHHKRTRSHLVCANAITSLETCEKSLGINDHTETGPRFQFPLPKPGFGCTLLVMGPLVGPRFRRPCDTSHHKFLVKGLGATWSVPMTSLETCDKVE